MSNISLFDPKLGIQSIIESQESYKLPAAKQLAASTVYDANESVYNPPNIKNILEFAVCPDTGDGELVRADVFAHALKNCAQELSSSGDQDIQDFLKKDLLPLLENSETLRTYYNLMLGG